MAERPTQDETQTPAKRPGGPKIDVSLAAFAVSVLFLAFCFGVVVQRFKIFPYPVIHEAARAFDALRHRDDDTLMAAAEADDAAPPRPKITVLSPKAGDEAILVTGGPYQNLERCPRFGCMAWVQDRQGRIIHSWEVDLKALTDGLTGFGMGFPPSQIAENVYPIGVALTPDGGLVAALHGRNMYPYEVGVVRVDRNGRILWKHFDSANHFLSVGPDGRIYSPATTVRGDLKYFGTTAVDVRCEGDKMLNDSVRVYSPDGAVEHDFPMQDVILNAGYPGLFYSVRDDCDPYHVNSVEVTSPQAASRLDGVNPGDLLVSVREESTILVLDGQTGAVKRIVTGRTAAQHSAVFEPAGTVLAFDNRGGERELGGTRIVRVNLDTGATETVFPRSKAQLPDGPFFAAERGRIDVSPDGGRALVASGEQGDIIEIDLKTGDPLWMMHKSFDITGYPKLTGKKAKAKTADFLAYGAYYVPDVSIFAAKP
ncbi:arylsulfotransferase family protein [Phenylobacterium sp.]|uniref:arylsulfotransferase family protein n=1 Tax=Phenylobacterium sp. TaxID=1871053 RepID=UPI0035AE9B7A